MKKLNKVFKNSKIISINDTSKIVIMSDVHRGAGDSYDNFLKNRIIFESALLHYYNVGFTYIELGDGDDMWEVKDYESIIEEHLDTFKLLKKFNDTNRFYMIYGNHDIEKRNKSTLKRYFYKYLNYIYAYESLILDYRGHDLFLLHGHQVDFLNGTLWRLSRFLVRHIWRLFEYAGIIKDPTRAGKNYRVTKLTEKKLNKWSIQNNKILISGHTHRPIFPHPKEGLYFNTGSCIHPNGITCIEIENGLITLVKWKYVLKDKKLISVDRTALTNSEQIIKYFKKQI